MKIVVVAPRLPYPLDKGDRLTVFHLLKFFSQRHELSLICFREPKQDPAWVGQFAPYCARIEVIPLRRSQAYVNCLTGLWGRTPLQLRYYFDSRMHRVVRKVVEETRPDLLYAHLIRMGQYIEPYPSLARVVAMNVSMTLNHQRLAEHTSGLSKAMHFVEYRKMRVYEGDFAARFDRVLLISKYDLDAIEQRVPLKNVLLNPHGVDCQHFTPDSSVPKITNSLIFTGNMRYAPNVDAARYFFREVLPLVRRQVPDATLFIVGADPAPAVQALASDPAVHVTGRVSDIRPFMNRAVVAIAPIRIGAGLQNKVLEGLSMGLPMVVTGVANEGIQAVDGEHLLVGETATDLADRIIRLLKERELRERLSVAARQFIAENWSWEKHFAHLETMFLELVKGKRKQMDPACLQPVTKPDQSESREPPADAFCSE